MIRKCNRCREEYDTETVKQYAWYQNYCCVECFLNMSKPNEIKVGDVVKIIDVTYMYDVYRDFLIGDLAIVDKINNMNNLVLDTNVGEVILPHNCVEKIKT